MAGDKLALLKLEIQKYLGIPYFTNKGKFKTTGSNVFVGKGTAKEIALETINLANQQNIKLLELSADRIYNFQKKNHLGIDCSGLACHLLNFYFDTKLDPRRTSAQMLTSSPLSQEIEDPTTGDLVQQKNGKHLLFIVEKDGNIINYIDSSFEGRGVRYGSFNINNPVFKHDGFFRLLLLN
ncbi:hypothetical protein HYV64_03115 [Candidatus Shapirobacteria bacterium]|nr:hypothetical protein [Candidatus Shapirobacteria bacterium]